MLWYPVASVLSILFLPTVLGGPVQQEGLTVPLDVRDKRDVVGNMFAESYMAYRQFAFGHDSLLPVSKSFSDGRNGWGATIVDAMDTMYIMGLDDFFKEALNFVSKIDFSKSQTSDTVSVFETTIRYVGGLLSAYELSGEKHDILLTKAREVTDKLTHAWLTVNDILSHIPYSHVDFAQDTPVIATSNVAEAGTLVLEFSTLSKHTDDNKYRGLAENAVTHIATLPAPLPGLPAQGIDPSTGLFVGAYVTWGGGTDSYFEYLIKQARLTNTDNTIFVDSWLTAVDSSIKNLLKYSTVGNHAYLSDFDDTRKTVDVGSHLACFHGGNWLLGGKILNNDTIVDYGLQLTDACWNTYARTAQDRYWTGTIRILSKNGFYITAPDYVLRPEVLESNFYAWRVTGDTKYLDRASKAIESFKKYLPATVAYSGINDVDSVTSPRIDDMESFWFAEVLKYLYLTFDDPSHISLDEYVFNTECHPFKAPPAKDSYGAKVLPGKPFTASPSHAPLPPVSADPNPIQSAIHL